MQIFYSVLLIALGVGFSIIGDIFLKKSELTNYTYVALGVLIYACGAIPVAFAFKKIEFGSVFMIWEAITVISAIIIASIVFKESFSFYKAIALVLAMAALYFSYK